MCGGDGSKQRRAQHSSVHLWFQQLQSVHQVIWGYPCLHHEFDTNLCYMRWPLSKQTYNKEPHRKSECTLHGHTTEIKRIMGLILILSRWWAEFSTLHWHDNLEWAWLMLEVSHQSEKKKKHRAMYMADLKACPEHTSVALVFRTIIVEIRE